jgi:carboxypeptidase PM20D1
MEEGIMKQELRTVFVVLVVFFTAFFSVLVFNLLNLRSKQLTTVAKPGRVQLDAKVIQNLSEALRYRTISYDNREAVDQVEFQKFNHFLKNKFPTVFRKAEIRNFNGSLLFKIKSQTHRKLPVLFYGHSDVVPAAVKYWVAGPFSGEINNGYLYGRGALDVKVNFMAILEALEYLLQRGIDPERDIYLLIGHDEELGGFAGAKPVAEALAREGVKFDCVFDEGGYIIDGVFQQGQKVALVGIAEKGYLTVKITVTVSPGHSSKPGVAAIALLAEAIHKIAKRQYNYKITGATRKMLEYLAPEMGFGYRLLVANMWLTEKLLIRSMAKSPTLTALMHTTIAPTIINGGEKENIMPGKAEAIINIRPLQGDSTKAIIGDLQKSIANKYVKLQKISFTDEASNLSDTDGEGFKEIQKSIKAIYPNAITVPYLLPGGTDSRFFRKITNNIYRFVPIETTMADIDGIHGNNERVSVKGYHKCIEFYIDYLKKL